MAKETGLGDYFFLDGYDLSGDIGAITNLHGGFSPIEVTGINKSAYERLGGQLSGEAEWSGFINTAAGQEHVALSPLPLTDRIGSYYHQAIIGYPAASIQFVQGNYDPTRTDKGELTTKLMGQSDAWPLEWGEQLTAGKTNITTAGNQNGFDYGTAIGTAGLTTFGLQAYMHVFAITGTSATVNIQHSNDNAVGDAYATVASFTAATTGPSVQRIQTSGVTSVKRWLRVNVTGTFSSFTFAVMAVKNATAVAF